MIPNSDRQKLTEAQDFKTLNISEYLATLINMIQTAKHSFNPDDCASIYFGLSGALGSLIPLLNKNDWIMDSGIKYPARDFLDRELRVLEKQTPLLHRKDRTFRIKYVIRCSKSLRAMMIFGNRYGYGPREKVTTEIDLDSLIRDDD
jgi:hypothetical protein